MAAQSNQAAKNDPLKVSRFYSFPPSFSTQRVQGTRQSQLKSWSKLIQRYCQYHRLWRLNVNEALETPLFHNSNIKKWLTLKEATEIIDYMCSDSGSHRAEWINESSAWIFWRSVADWADLLADWVDETGQKGTVLTLYELTEGEATTRQDFYGMPSELLKRVLGSLVKRSKAQIFGTEGEQGVKFF